MACTYNVRVTKKTFVLAEIFVLFFFLFVMNYESFSIKSEIQTLLMKKKLEFWKILVHTYMLMHT